MMNWFTITNLVDVFRKTTDDEINQWEYAEEVPIQFKEQRMPLKEVFLRYCELQRNANSIRESNGIDDSRTIDAYKEANEYKRKVLDMIEDLES